MPTLNHRVGGSSPSQPTYERLTAFFLLTFFLGVALRLVVFFTGFKEVLTVFLVDFFFVDFSAALFCNLEAFSSAASAFARNPAIRA